MRFGALLLNLLHLHQHFTALLLQLRQQLLLVGKIFLSFDDALAQLREFFLLKFELLAVGHRQRFALLRQTVTPTSDDLQRTLGMTAVGLLDLQALFGLGQHRALAIDFVLRANLRFLDQRQALVLRRQSHLAGLDAFVGVYGQVGPARLIRLKLSSCPCQCS